MDLDYVTVLELGIVPDIGGGDAIASVERIRVSAASRGANVALTFGGTAPLRSVPC